MLHFVCHSQQSKMSVARPIGNRHAEKEQLIKLLSLNLNLKVTGILLHNINKYINGAIRVFKIFICFPSCNENLNTLGTEKETQNTTFSLQNLS